jgi:hypothetical protein
MATKTEHVGITLLSVTGVAPDRRESVKAAIIAAGGNLRARYEAWVVGALRPPAYIVRVIGPSGFYREEKFTGREPAVEITERIRELLVGETACAAAAAL